MLTENLVAVENLTGNKVEFMGELLWYSLTDSRITREQLTALFSEHGISSGYLPRPINNRDAFRRSTWVAEVKRHPLDEKNKQYLNLLVREVKMDEKELVRQLVREIVDSKNKRLSYKPIVSFKLTGEDGDIFEMDCLEELSEFERRQIDKVIREFDVNKRHYDSNHLRNIIKNILADCYPISVRPSGGVLFIPQEYHETVDAVKNFIRSLNDYSITSFKSQAWTVPVVNLSEQREMVSISLEDQVESESEALIKEMKKALERRGNMRSKTVQGFVNRVKALQGLVKEYEEMLQFKALRASSAIDIAMQQAMALMENIEDEEAAAQTLF